MSTIRNFVHELPNKLPNDLRLNLLRNKELKENAKTSCDTV